MSGRQPRWKNREEEWERERENKRKKKRNEIKKECRFALDEWPQQRNCSPLFSTAIMYRSYLLLSTMTWRGVGERQRERERQRGREKGRESRGVTCRNREKKKTETEKEELRDRYQIGPVKSVYQ